MARPFLTSVLLYFGVSGAIALLFAYVGYPLACWLRVTASDPFRVRTILLGVCLLTGLSWLWQSVTGQGLFPFTYVVLAANAPPFLLTVRRRGFRLSAKVKQACWPLLGLALSAATFARYYRDVLAGGGLRPASLGNSDLPLYAIIADHLRTHGFGSSGAIPGMHLGAYAHDDYYGAFAALAQTAGVLHLDISLVVMPLMLFAVFALVTALATLLNTTTALPRWQTLALGWVGGSTSLYFYTVGEGFLAEILALPLIVILLQHLGPAPRGLAASSSRLLTEAALLLVGLLMLYPHMALLGVPVLFGVAAATGYMSSQPILTAAVRPLVHLTGALLLASLLVPNRASVAIHETLAAGGALAGWTLHRASLVQIFGLQAYPNESSGVPSTISHAAALHTISWRLVFLTLLVTACLTLLVKRAMNSPDRSADQEPWAWLVALTLLPLASYYVIYGYFGPGYQQWKWLSFLQPVVMAGLSGLVVTLLHAEARQLRWPPLLSAGASTVPLVALATLVMTPPAYPHPAQVAPAVAALSRDPRLESGGPVNINAAGSPTPAWDAMWSVYFLHGRAVRVTSTSNFPLSQADPRAPTVVVGPAREVRVQRPGLTTSR